LPHCYTRVLIEDGSTLKNTFYALSLSGVNVTVPHKEDAFAACDVLDEYAKDIGAVNTIVLGGDKLYGYNTDAPGFMASLDGFIPKNVLILGAGGTARAIAYALKKDGIKTLIANRSKERLSFFTQRGFNCITFDNLDVDGGYDLIVNTTSAGLANTDDLPLSCELLSGLFKNASLAYDCIYKKTAFLKLADSMDIRHKDGLDMLVWQAFYAFEKFNAKKFDVSLIEVMKRGI
jgi:shikimate dehydrogenase